MKHRPQFNVETRDRLLPILFPLLLLIVWEIAVHVGWLDSRFFPAPTAILAALANLISKGELLGKLWLVPELIGTGNWPGVLKVFQEGHLWISLYRIFAGFVLGAVPGIALGTLMGMNRAVRNAFEPIFSALYVLPKVAILPLVMLVLGIGEASKIAIVAIASFFLVLFNTMAGVRDIDTIYLEAGRNYGANRWQMFRHVILPGASPFIFVGLRLSLGTALIVIIAAEFVAAQYGLGYLVWFSWQTLLTENMFAGLVVIMVLGVLFTSGLHALERRLIPWQREERRMPMDASDMQKQSAKS